MDIVKDGRLAYIEPNLLPSKSIRKGKNVNPDNITWNQEDLTCFVNLSVKTNSRNACFEENVNTYRTLFYEGETLGSGNINHITDGYIDNINYDEGKDLMLEELKITLDSSFCPRVDAKIIDVRGNSLFDKRKNNLFNTIFTFPYPTYKLTAKGYYGRPMSLSLAVNEFNTSFNQNTGNYEIDLSFVGDMFGVFTDIPFNLALIVPHVEISNTTYWDSFIKNSNFCNGKNYEDNGELQNYITFLLNYIALPKNLEKQTTVDIEAYKQVETKLLSLTKVIDSANKVMSSFNNILHSEDYNYQTKPESYIANSDYTIVSEITGLDISSLESLIKEYVDNRKALAESSNINITSEDPLKAFLNGEDIKTTFDCSANTTFTISSLNNEIASKKSEYTVELDNLEKSASSDMEALISEDLGFNPTIYNWFRMIFAHVYVLTGAIKGICSAIKKDQRKPIDGVIFDIPDGYDFLPPFPAVLDNEGKLKYPGEEESCKGMYEVDFVDKIVEKALTIKKTVLDATQNAEADTSNETTFSETCVLDFLFYGANGGSQNPYSYIPNYSKSDMLSIVIKQLLLRYTAAACTNNGENLEDLRKKEIDNVKRLLGKISDDSIKEYEDNDYKDLPNTIKTASGNKNIKIVKDSEEWIEKDSNEARVCVVHNVNFDIDDDNYIFTYKNKNDITSYNKIFTDSDSGLKGLSYANGKDCDYTYIDSGITSFNFTNKDYNNKTNFISNLNIVGDNKYSTFITNVNTMSNNKRSEIFVVPKWFIYRYAIDSNAKYNDLKQKCVEVFNDWDFDNIKSKVVNGKLQKNNCDDLFSPCVIVCLKVSPYFYITKEELKSLITGLCNDDDKEGNNGGGENNLKTVTVESDNISTEMKMAVYYTLKNIYDKWLCNDNINKYKIFGNEAYKDEIDRIKNGIFPSFYNYSLNFLYVDAYMNDIGSKLILNPKTVYEIMMSHLDAKSNYSIFQFMSSICNQNDVRIISLPKNNYFYGCQNLNDIFTPHSSDLNVENGKNPEMIYLCMYTYEPSHTLDSETFRYSSDGLYLVNSSGEINSQEVKQFVSNGGFVVPCFGVSYGRGQQNYFKNIAITMDTPRLTDESIKNLFDLSNIGGSGHITQPFASGQDLFTIYSNRSYTCTVDMIGCVNISPTMYFQLNNVPMFRGAYIITDVIHNFKAGDITTTFNGVRISKNQLPFNKDIFNVKVFIQMLKQYGYGAGAVMRDVSDKTTALSTSNLLSDLQEGDLVTWIGDSHSTLGLPKLVLDTLVNNHKVKYYSVGIKSQTFQHYLSNSTASDKPKYYKSKDNKVTNTYKLTDIVGMRSKYCIIALGTNDAILYNTSKNTYFENKVKPVCEQFKAVGTKLILIGSPGFNKKYKGSGNITWEVANECVKELQDKCVNSGYFTGFIDLLSVTNWNKGGDSEWDKYTSDGIHLSQNRYRKLAESIETHL